LFASSQKHLAKTFATLIKTKYMLLYPTECLHPMFLPIHFIFFPVPDYYLMMSESNYSCCVVSVLGISLSCLCK